MLSIKQIDELGHEGRDRLVADIPGLFLRVRPSGKSWTFLYTSPLSGKQARISFGSYPKVQPATARQLTRDAFQLLAIGKDPKSEKLEKRQAARLRDLASFEQVARDWHKHATATHEWTAGYSHRVLRMMELHAFPRLGKLPIGLITTTDVLDTLQAVSASGTRETAIRLRESIQRTYRHAVTRNVLLPTENFMAKGVADFTLPAPRVKHMAAILDPQKLGQLLRDLDAYRGSAITKAALKLMPLIFQRPGQVRQMLWEQLDLAGAVWRCPGSQVKQTKARRALGGGADHIVPLPYQAVDILKSLHRVTGPSGPVFRSISRRSESSRFMSDNTVNAALRSLGYNTQDEITGHGFRATARTLIRERLGFDVEVIERHLAHESKEELGSAYDRAQFAEQRRQMVQAWADYLDQLKGQRE
ncbi:tyrosine-type recombinase/integrase [Kerstersia gyiorum]|uniref:tyrosine-type recombinase/integrase n=1 Tax=Kerstersia gyiorum TaxID=206506 RepID=UPI0021500E6E|nr:integrase arm-type DNA-binding domain-containing protein [Kerstersia gyiorum]MCR4158007.1 tyrosine-type recombinase/integrase [Kerstersia gyiorum]